MTAASATEERVLILTPIGRDGPLICDMLQRAGIQGEICRSVDDLASHLKEGAGVTLLAEEALRSDGLADLFRELHEQPAWSDPPFLLLTSAGANLSAAG